jgi:hypothetical protein
METLVRSAESWFSDACASNWSFWNVAARISRRTVSTLDEDLELRSVAGEFSFADEGADDSFLRLELIERFDEAVDFAVEMEVTGSCYSDRLRVELRFLLLFVFVETVKRFFVVKDRFAAKLDRRGRRRCRKIIDGRELLAKSGRGEVGSA